MRTFLLICAPVFLTSIAAAKPAIDFLDARIDSAALAKLHPARATIVLSGARYERRDSPPEKVVEESMMAPVAVLDDTNSKRVRVVCDEEKFRVAVWVDVAALATVAKRDLVLTSELPVIAKPTRDSVGIHVRAGTGVVRLEAESSNQLVRVHGVFFTSGGYTDARSIGVSYVPAAEPERVDSLDGEIAASLEIYDAPNGALLAHVAKSANTANRLYVQKLATEGVWVKLRYDEGDLAVVGWAKNADVTWLEKTLRPGTMGHGSGYGTGVVTDTVEVKKGMRIFGRKSGDAIGVVLEDTQLTLAPACAASDRRVQVTACGSILDVRVR